MKSSSQMELTLLEAFASEKSGDTSEALRLYGSLPDHPVACLNAGTIHYKQGRYQEAESCYRRALAVDPDYTLAHFNLGNVLDETSPSDAVDAYLRACELCPTYADAHFNLALAYEKIGHFGKALKHWRIYSGMDRTGPWFDCAASRVRLIVERSGLSLVGGVK